MSEIQRSRISNSFELFKDSTSNNTGSKQMCPKCKAENERLKSERLDFENREGAICPACNGTGKQPPVDKIQRFKFDYQKRIESLESELDAARGEIDEERKYSRCLLDQRDKLQAEKERLKKAEVRASKGVVYLAGLLSVKTKEKLSVDWIQEALNLED